MQTPLSSLLFSFVFKSKSCGYLHGRLSFGACIPHERGATGGARVRVLQPQLRLAQVLAAVVAAGILVAAVRV